MSGEGDCAKIVRSSRVFELHSFHSDFLYAFYNDTIFISLSPLRSFKDTDIKFVSNVSNYPHY